jgi:gas vesicle protein
MADSQHTGGLVFLSFVVGSIVGAALGVLFAPKPGKETREDIAEAAGELKKEAEKLTKEAKQRIDGFVEDSKAAIAKLSSKEKTNA